jgi:tetratricopeptide (TPR) repeat protein
LGEFAQRTRTQKKAQIRDVLREDDAALELYDRAIAAGHPRPATLHSARAYLLEEHGRQAEAEAAWDAAVASEPASATLREGRAKFFLRTHQRPKAMLDFERILSCAGAEGEKAIFLFVHLVVCLTFLSAHGYELFSHLARERGQLEEAEKHAEDALAVHPAADRVEVRKTKMSKETKVCSKRKLFVLQRLACCLAN